MRETVRATQAFNDYYALGPDRSLEALSERYQSEKAEGHSVPTTRRATLADWSRNFHWQQRLCDMASAALAEEQRQSNEGRLRILSEGIAAKVERIKDLQAIRDRLMARFEDDTLLDPIVDIKVRKVDDKLERFEIHKLDIGLIQQIRGVLDDAAKEMGERTPPATQGLMELLREERANVTSVLREELADEPERAERVLAKLIARADAGGALLRQPDGLTDDGEGWDAPRRLHA